MRDPGLVELEHALTWRCDTLLASEVALDRGEVLVMVDWRYHDRGFRARLIVPPERRVSWLRWIIWRLAGQRFAVLPSRPVFEWHGPCGWERAATVAGWRGAFHLPGGEAPGTAPGEWAGRPVRPRPGLPSLSAGAAAIPEPAIVQRQRYPSLALLRRYGEE